MDGGLELEFEEGLKLGLEDRLKEWLEGGVELSREVWKVVWKVCEPLKLVGQSSLMLQCKVFS